MMIYHSNGDFMQKRFLFTCLILLFSVSTPFNVSANHKIIRRKIIRNATITAGKRLTVQNKGKTINTQIMDGGIEDVFSGAVSQNAKVFNGGKLWLAGGKSYGAVVHDGGLMEVREHDNKSSYSTNTKLLPGGRMNVFNHSLAEKITVDSKGFLRVYFPGAVISDVIILSGALVHVWKHGTAQNVYVAPGGVLELREEAPVLKGTIRIAGQLKASFDHHPDVRQAKIILDLTKRKAPDAYYIENLDYLKEADISVIVSPDQEYGSRMLASGTVNWWRPLRIAIENGRSYMLKLREPLEINGKYYTLKKVNDCLELKISDALPDAEELIGDPEISPEHRAIFKSYGLDIFTKHYSVSPSGRKFTQQELDNDVSRMIKDLKLLGRKCVMMSRTRKIFINGSMRGGANQGGDTLNFAPGAAGAFRHEFNHNFEPFGLAYHFWCKLNHKRFVYRYGTRGLPYREILNADSNVEEFADDFDQKYGQETIHEDITTIFASATSPASAARCLEKSRKSPAYRKKLYLLIASYLEVTTWKFWDQFFNFTPEEKKQIECSYIDVEKERGLKIFYTRNAPRRYSYQRLTTMWFTEISPAMINASGIRKIKFFKRPSHPKLDNDTLIVYDDDHPGMIRMFFRACYRRYPHLVKKYLKNRRSQEKWAELFQWCATKEFMRHVAQQSCKNPALHQDVICLQNFTKNWLPPEFWKEYNWFYSEYKKDLEYLKIFNSYGIKLNTPLPAPVNGEELTEAEIELATRTFIACTSVLTSDFMKKCGIKAVAFGKRLKADGKSVRDGVIYVDGILCIDPSAYWHKRNIFKHLYRLYAANLMNGANGSDLDETFALLLGNSYNASVKAKQNPELYENIRNIMDMNILQPHAYENMNLNRIIQFE